MQTRNSMDGFHNVCIQDKCDTCELRRKGFFCEFADADLQLFQSIRVPKSVSKGSMLFIEGQPSKGVFMLCQGKVKLSTCSAEGKVIILEIAEPGDMLGLSAALSASDHETSAEAVQGCQINYVETGDLLRFLQCNPRASLNAARQMSRNYQTAYRQICALGMSDSVVDKLARLFISWSGSVTCPAADELHLKNAYTHEEMAEMIGVSRETVTRALRYFRENGLVTLKGSDLYIHNVAQLRAIIGSRRRVPSVY